MSASVFALPSYKVLVLHSYSRDSVWTDRLDQSIKANISSSDKYLTFFTEYMDTKRFFSAEYKLALKNLLSKKYKNKNIQLIIATDDNAFNFAMNNRAELFPQSGIIFTGLNGIDGLSKNYQNSKNFSGLVEKFKIAETVKMGLKIHPRAKKIYVFNTIHTPSGIALKREFENAFKNMKLNLEIEYLEDYKITQLYKKSETLDIDSFALYGAYSRDKDGRFLDFEKNLGTLSKYSSVPIYGFLKYYLPYGLTGGYFTSAEEYGKGAALMANEFIAGRSLDEIPIVYDVKTPILFDYRKIEKFNIDISKLPQGVEILNNTNKLLKFYRDFTFEFWFILFSFICLITSLIVLYYHFEQQKKHKKAVLKINEQLEERVEKRTKQLIEQQSKLINSAKLASIGEMASGIAHEINNPLTIIDLCAYRMLQISHEPVVVKSALKIKDTVERITKIIQGLKQLSKEEGNLTQEQISINAAIADVVSICRAKFHENEIDFTIDIEKDLKVFGASVQVSQVVLNLLNNAFDEINRIHGNKWIKLIGRRTQGMVEISVTDSGPGISEEIYDKIMEPFFTTKVEQRGTGLGLSICKNIIEHHRGIIFVDRKSPNTRFVVQIPAI